MTQPFSDWDVFNDIIDAHKGEPMALILSADEWAKQRAATIAAKAPYPIPAGGVEYSLKRYKGYALVCESVQSEVARLRPDAGVRLAFDGNAFRCQLFPMNPVSGEKPQEADVPAERVRFREFI